jgi:hypothetical protein
MMASPKERIVWYCIHPRQVQQQFEKSNREALHSNRVSNICRSIACKMNFNEDETHQMKGISMLSREKQYQFLH